MTRIEAILTRPMRILIAATLALSAGLAVPGAQGTVSVTVNVDRAARHQTMLGWGGTLSFNRNLSYVTQPVVDQLVDELVDNLGLTFLRVQDGVLDEPLNDNSDPNVIDWSRFHDGAVIDREVTRGLGRFIARVRARGLQPTIMLVKDWRGAIPSWMTDAEIAEHLFATVRFYKDHHNIDIAFVAVANEPESSSLPIGRQQTIARLFDAKVHADGLPTKLTFNEGRNAETTWSAATAVTDASFWSRVGLISWHGPGSTDGVRAQLRDFAAARQIPTAMTGFPGATIEDLFNDLTLADVSYWARNWIVESGLAAESNDNTYFALGYDGVSFRHNQAYHRFREVMAYVPVGAVRVEATSSNPGLRVAVFEKDGIAYVVALNTSSTRMSVSVQGLSSFATTRTFWSFSGPEGMTVPIIPTNSRPTFLDVPAGESAANVPAPPDATLPTIWLSTPASVSSPLTTSVRLKVRAITFLSAGDFGDTLPARYDWELTDGPSQDQVVIDEDGRGFAEVKGLSVGTYEFRVLVSSLFGHGVSSSRTLRLRVFSGNQAPVITEGQRYLRDEWLVLPRSSETYGPDFISAGDIDGDPVTTSFGVIGQPPGASASFSGPTVNGMTRAGDYVFRFTASDATHAVTRDFVRHVVEDDDRSPGGVGRRRPLATEPRGVAVPRTSQGAQPVVVPTNQQALKTAAGPMPGDHAGQRQRTIDAEWLGDLLDVLVRNEEIAGPGWRWIQAIDVDEDGVIDLVRIGFVTGLIWTIYGR